jgi:hypothetical protein
MATRKITVTIPEDLLEEVRAASAERGISAYVAEALRIKLDQDQLAELVDWLQDEYGPLTEEDETATDEFLAEVRAEHDRRRSNQEAA